MKKIFIIIVSIFISLCSTPILAQLEDPGADPDAPAAPIDGYVWILALVGLFYIFIRLKTFAQQTSTSRE
jgi:hypothetical protein